MAGDRGGAGEGAGPAAPGAGGLPPEPAAVLRRRPLGRRRHPRRRRVPARCHADRRRRHAGLLPARLALAAVWVAGSLASGRCTSAAPCTRARPDGEEAPGHPGGRRADPARRRRLPRLPRALPGAAGRPGVRGAWRDPRPGRRRPLPFVLALALVNGVAEEVYFRARCTRRSAGARPGDRHRGVRGDEWPAATSPWWRRRS